MNPGMSGRYTLHYNRVNALPLACARHDGLQLLDSSERTKLTERAVNRLAPGRRVSVSGTLVTSYYDWSQCSEEMKAIFPIIPESALRATLGILDRTVAKGGPRPQS